MNNEIKIKPAVKYCPRCGRELPIEADVCICGEEQPDFTIRRMESKINSLLKEKRSLKKHQSTSRIVARMMLILGFENPRHSATNAVFKRFSLAIARHGATVFVAYLSHELTLESYTLQQKPWGKSPG